MNTTPVPTADEISMTADHYDVIIVGAGLAGCTAAMLYARRGLQVALIEKKDDPADYKKICTHYLQPKTIPLLKRLGLYDAVMEAGATFSGIVLKTPWGDVPAPRYGRDRYGLNLRRELLDPIFHHAAMAEPGVDWWGGCRVSALLWEDGRVQGVRTQPEQGEGRAFSAPLVIGADGRDSAVAKMAGVTTRSFHNERFSFFQYFRNLESAPDNETRVWILDGGASYVTAFPNGDLTLVSCYVPEHCFDQWRSDVENHYRAFVARAPGGPDLDRAVPASRIRGMRKAPTIRRTPSAPGLALLGDSALALDPLVGIGCTWAIESAFMLEGATAKAFQADTPRALNHRVDVGLRRYRWRHHLYFGVQSALFIPLSKARPYGRGLKWLLRMGRRADKPQGHLS